MNALLQIEGITKSFGPVTAVDKLSLTVKQDEFFAILGPSGCGKTTLLRVIAGFEQPDEGRVTLDGADITGLKANRRPVNLMFQSYALFPHMSVLENAAYGPTVSGIPRKQAEAMAAEKLALMGLKGFEKRLPSELSGGQQQRVAVARALVLEPRVLLFDEPLSNLDAKLRRRVREDIRELQRRLNLTVAYVTHDQEEALAVSDRIIVMSNAVIAQEGTPRDLYEQPANLFVADFIGDSNIVDAEVMTVSGERASVRLGPLTLDLPARGVTKPGAAKLAVRPEAVQIATEEGDSGLPATVARAAYLGGHMEYSLQTASGTFFVIDGAVGRPLAVGSSVSISFRDFGLTLLPV